MKRIFSWSLLLVRLAIIGVAFWGLVQAGIKLQYLHISLPVILLACVHTLPFVGIVALLVFPNRWTSLAGISGLIVFTTISYYGANSWAVRGYFSGLGPGRPHYTQLYGILLAFPAVVMQTVFAWRKEKPEGQRAIILAHFRRKVGLNFQHVRRNVFIIYFSGLLVLILLNLLSFQTSRWTYMYQAYIWPGLCCPDCAIHPTLDYTGCYRRWGYQGEMVEQAQLLNGEYHGWRFMISEIYGTHSQHWAHGRPHGIEKSWDAKGRLVTVGTWRDGKEWDGQFWIDGKVATIKNGMPWTGVFPRFRTEDSGYRYKDGEITYKNGTIILSRRYRTDGGPGGPFFSD